MSEITRKELLDRIESLIAVEDFVALREVLSTSRPADIAEVMEVLDEVARQMLFDLLDPQEAGEVLEKIDEATRSEIVEGLSSTKLTDIVATLSPDDAADVVADLTREKAEQVLDHIPPAESVQIGKLLRYRQDSAGGIMNPDLIKANIHGTIDDAIRQIRRSESAEDFYFIFVVDDAGRYMGEVSIHELLRHPGDTLLANVLQKEIPVVNVGADQEEIANIFRKNDLIAMPVVDEKNLLVGRITVDDVVDVMEEEAEEDALVMAGTNPSELDTPHIFKAASIRLPWLLTCLFGSMMSLLVVYHWGSHFSHLDWLCVTMFMPAIAAMGGNSGLQTSTIVVRGLATGDLVALKFMQVFARESRVALIVAVLCGSITGTIASLIFHFGSGRNILSVSHPTALSLAVGLAMFCGIMLATTLGLALPFMFRRLGIDPAISSGPMVTTANDTISYMTYFSLALLFLHLFGG